VRQDALLLALVPSVPAAWQLDELLGRPKAQTPATTVANSLGSVPAL
jgi:hypothetical protein